MVIAVAVGFVVFGFAFDKTQVDLGQIQSQTRQESLTRILRLLAHPELVQYDLEQQLTEVPVAVPCGPEVSGTATVGQERGSVTVTPACARPGDTMTVTGSGFNPLQAVQVNFVPDSEFPVTLSLARLQTDDSGSFVTEFEVPDRPSDIPQSIQVVTAVRIGSWGNRQEVWTDSNENGIKDIPRIGANGRTVLTTDIRIPDAPGAALIDSSFSVVSFISFGQPFLAVAGPANGQQAVTPSDASGDVFVESMGDGQVVVDGPPNTDITQWRVAVYDSTDGSLIGVEALADVIDLSPRISKTALLTWDKIVETVMLAFLATSAGLLLAIPLSFLAARNIMRDISSTVTNLALTLLAVPAGMYLGIHVSRLVQMASEPIRGNIALTLLFLAAVPVVVVAILQAAVPPKDDVPVPATTRAARQAALLGAGIVGLLGIQFASEISDRVGRAIEGPLGPFGFLGGFLQQLSQLNDVLTPIITAIAGAAVMITLASRLGYLIRSRLGTSTVHVIDFATAALAGAVWFLMIGAVLDWFYRFGSTTVTVTAPAILGAGFGVFLVARNFRSGEIKVGLTVYYIARTIFNTLRSIEPLVMVIVFVVWVGFGAFAGSLALALHTTAALAKLYSEQVESISQGPVEAIRATGATRLQTVVYGVVPQIVPPYISFTMYRWDINVRMSTILGFAGGGGIGFLLAQNVNLLHYQAASVQMLAIAVVVASMDYLSARIRERVV